MKPQHIPTTEEMEIRALIDETVKACRAKDAAAERAEEWFSSWQGDFTYEIHQLSVTASGDTGFCHSLNHVSGTQNGDQPVDMWWRATVCCRKTAGKWWVTHLHSSVSFDMETGKASLDLKP